MLRTFSDTSFGGAAPRTGPLADFACVVICSVAEARSIHDQLESLGGKRLYAASAKAQCALTTNRALADAGLRDKVDGAVAKNLPLVAATEWLRACAKAKEQVPFEGGFLLTQPPRPKTPKKKSLFSTPPPTPEVRPSAQRELALEDVEDDGDDEEEDDATASDEELVKVSPVAHSQPQGLPDGASAKYTLARDGPSRPVRMQGGGNVRAALAAEVDDVTVTVRDFRILHNCHMAENKNKYYVMELVAAGGKHKIVTHYGRTDDLEADPNSGRREVRAFPDEGSATAYFSQLCTEKFMVKKYRDVKLLTARVGTKKLQQVVAEKAQEYLAALQGGSEAATAAATHTLSGGFVPRTPQREVLELVDGLYKEAATSLSGVLTATITAKGLLTPMGVLSPGQIEVGEQALDKVEAFLKRGAGAPVTPGASGLDFLSSEFFTYIPHKLGEVAGATSVKVLRTMAQVNEKRELLQLMKDMQALSGAAGEHETARKYAALRCNVSMVNPKVEEFSTLRKLLEAQKRKEFVNTVRLTKAFKVARGDELSRGGIVFPGKATDHNKVQRLFHGSRPSNMVGILSRGLLLPKHIEGTGGPRTNSGWLGSGIYFADASCTAGRYSPPAAGGQSYMVVASVCTGVPKEYTEPQPQLEAPPAGYDSVKGVGCRMLSNGSSSFEDNEFVVYDVSRFTIDYIVEVTIKERLPLPSELAMPSRPLPAQPTPSEEAGTARVSKPAKPFKLPAWGQRTKGEPAEKSWVPAASGSVVPASWAAAAPAAGVPAAWGAPAPQAGGGEAAIEKAVAGLRAEMERLEEKYVTKAEFEAYRASAPAVPALAPPTFDARGGFGFMNAPSGGAFAGGAFAPTGAHHHHHHHHFNPAAASGGAFANKSTAPVGGLFGGKAPAKSIAPSAPSKKKTDKKAPCTATPPCRADAPAWQAQPQPASAARAAAAAAAPSGVAYPALGPFGDDAENDRIEAEERRLRKYYAAGRTALPFEYLLDVYANLQSFMPQPLSRREVGHAKLLTHYVKPHAQGNRVVPRKVFDSTLNEMLQGQLDGLNWRNVFLGGGCVLGALLERPDLAPGVPDQSFRGSDVDLFLWGIATDEDARAKIDEIVEVVEANRKRQSGRSAAKASKRSPGVLRTPYAVTIMGCFPFRHVQIVLRMYKTPSQILVGFDVDSCALGYDGTTVWANPRARRAITKQMNTVDMTRRSLTYEVRLAKYARRGFAVAVPDVDLELVDVPAHKQAKLTSGLEKLIVLDRCETQAVAQLNQQSPQSVEKTSALLKRRSRQRLTKRAARELKRSVKRTATNPDWSGSTDDEKLMDHCDYSNVMLPWGPSYTTQYLNHLSFKKDQGQFFHHDGKFHRHISMSGPDALKGFTAWCSECRLLKNKGKPYTPTRADLGTAVDEARSTYVFGPVVFVREDPGRQLLTGSFHPVADDQWAAGVNTRSARVAAGARTFRRDACDASESAWWAQQISGEGSSGAAVARAAAPAAPAADAPWFPSHAAGAASSALSSPKKTPKTKASAPWPKSGTPTKQPAVAGGLVAARVAAAAAWSSKAPSPHLPSHGLTVTDGIYILTNPKARKLEGTVARLVCVDLRSATANGRRPQTKLQEEIASGSAVVFMGSDRDPAAYIATQVVGSTVDEVGASAAVYCGHGTDAPGPALPHPMTFWRFKQTVAAGCDLREVVYVGAKLREFDDAHYRFAVNCGMTVASPEEFFDGAPASLPPGRKFHPKAYPSAARLWCPRPMDPQRAVPDFAPGGPWMVVLVGFPGSGKSSFYRRHLLPQGLAYVNNDTQADTAEAIAFQAAATGTSVCIDNLNNCRAARAKWVALAKASSMKLALLHLDTPRVWTHTAT